MEPPLQHSDGYGFTSFQHDLANPESVSPEGILEILDTIGQRERMNVTVSIGKNVMSTETWRSDAVRTRRREKYRVRRPVDHYVRRSGALYRRQIRTLARIL